MNICRSFNSIVYFIHQKWNVHQKWYMNFEWAIIWLFIELQFCLVTEALKHKLFSNQILACTHLFTKNQTNTATVEYRAGVRWLSLHWVKNNWLTMILVKNCNYITQSHSNWTKINITERVSRLTSMLCSVNRLHLKLLQTNLIPNTIGWKWCLPNVPGKCKQNHSEK